MNFNFVDPAVVSVTNYKYEDFDHLVQKFGYKIEKNGFLHKYFSWSEITHWTFQYAKYNAEELERIFNSSGIIEKNIGFYIRLTSDMPLILIDSNNLGHLLEDLCYETGMGWEGISNDGRFILEFPDSFEQLAISNFKLEET